MRRLLATLLGLLIAIILVVVVDWFCGYMLTRNDHIVPQPPPPDAKWIHFQVPDFVFEKFPRPPSATAIPPVNSYGMNTDQKFQRVPGSRDYRSRVSSLRTRETLYDVQVGFDSVGRRRTNILVPSKPVSSRIQCLQQCNFRRIDQLHPP